MTTDERRFLGALGYRFRDDQLLDAALTHRSAGAFNNERLEFLGDGLLNAVVAVELFALRPAATEGELSRLRAWLVREETLAAVARDIGLGPVLRLGEGERKSGSHRRSSILADGVEAVIGAVYLDSDFATVRDVVLRLLHERLKDLPTLDQLKDPKTRLQEYLQGRGHPLPEYEVTASHGADHARRFTVRCRVGALGLEDEATASSRRRAEQRAAEACLERIERMGTR